jgi:hypothetical protein
MGYDSSKLTLYAQAIAGKKLFLYEDTGGESTGTYQGAGYFANAKAVGADTGDLVKIFDKANNETYDGVFITVQDTGATTGTVKITDTD